MNIPQKRYTLFGAFFMESIGWLYLYSLIVKQWFVFCPIFIYKY